MSQDHEDLMVSEAASSSRWQQALEECAIEALFWKWKFGKTELELRIDSDRFARVWRTKLLPDGELWVWSRAPAPGSPFELEWVYDKEWLTPYWFAARYTDRPDLGGENNGRTIWRSTEEVHAG